MDFFKYEDDFVGIKSQMLSLPHIILLVITLVFLVIMMFFFKKMSERKMDIFIKVSSIFVFVMEAIYEIWEGVQCYLHGHGYNMTQGLPLFTCTLFVYCLLLAAWTKGKVKETSLAFLTTIGILSGATGIILVNGMNRYPFWSYGALYSYYFHYFMFFVAVAIIVSDYYRVKMKSSLLTMFPIVALSIIAIPVDYIYEADYMLLYKGQGAPLMSDLAAFLAANNLRPLYTVIMLITYIPLALLIVGIVNGIKWIIRHLHKQNKEVTAD